MTVSKRHATAAATTAVAAALQQQKDTSITPLSSTYDTYKPGTYHPKDDRTFSTNRAQQQHSSTCEIAWPHLLTVAAICISVSSFVTTAHTACTSLGWRIGTHTGCAGCRWVRLNTRTHGGHADNSNIQLLGTSVAARWLQRSNRHHPVFTEYPPPRT